MRVHCVELQKGIYVPLFRGSMQWNNEAKHFQWLDFYNTLHFTPVVHLKMSELNQMYIIV